MLCFHKKTKEKEGVGAILHNETSLIRRSTTNSHRKVAREHPKQQYCSFQAVLFFPLGGLLCDWPNSPLETAPVCANTSWLRLSICPPPWKHVEQVYKENLVETILPSIQSVMTAVLHYKKMGGEANLYINDDGLQVTNTLRKYYRTSR